MDEHLKQVVGYIKQCQAQGVAADVIGAKLKGIGWPIDVINQGMMDCGLPPVDDSAPPAATSPSVSPPATRSLQEIAAQFDKVDEPAAPKFWSADPPALEGATAGDKSAPQQYWLLRAVNESIAAIVRNLFGFLISIAVSAVVLAGSFMLVSTLMGAVVFGQSAILTASVATLLGGMIILLFAYTLCYAFAGAFFITISCLAIYDGKQKRLSNLKILFRDSLERTAPVIRATATYAFIIFWPMMLLVAVPLIVLIGGSNGFVVLVMLLVMIVALIVTIAGLFRYSLIPYIAVFEPEVPIPQLLDRSRRLINRGGYWFLGKGLACLIVLSLLVFFVFNFAFSALSTGPLWALTIMVFIDSVLINGVMLMFYLNRRALDGEFNVAPPELPEKPPEPQKPPVADPPSLALPPS